VEAIDSDPGTIITTAAHEAVRVRDEMPPDARPRAIWHPRRPDDSALEVASGGAAVDALVSRPVRGIPSCSGRPCLVI
jgi:hypothetical protein